MSTRRSTGQQRAIGKAFEDAGRPLSVQEVHEQALEHSPKLGLRTVYRVLNRLVEDGEIVPVAVLGQPDRYELASAAGGHHHHHFHCTSCDRVFDLEACPGGLSSMLPPGYELEGHEIALWGRCEACAE